MTTCHAVQCWQLQCRVAAGKLKGRVVVGVQCGLVVVAVERWLQGMLHSTVVLPSRRQQSDRRVGHRLQCSGCSWVWLL